MPRRVRAGGRRAACFSSGHATRNCWPPFWRALDGLVLSLQVPPDFEARLSLQGRAEALPPAARRALATAKQVSELWERFPQDSILTMAIRADALALKDALAEFVPPSDRA